MIWAYLAGLATLPILYGLFVGIVVGYFALERWAARFGWSIEWHNDRNTDAISDYRLRRDIWFERVIGPFYSGHWVRDDHREGTHATRWIALGNTNGRNLTIYHERVIRDAEGDDR